MAALRKLRVIYAGWGERWLLGTLADDGRQVLFEYSPQAHARGLELSPLKLPLTMTGARRGEAFFMGLPGLIADALPDGWGLLLMDRYFRQQGRNPAQISVLERLALLGEGAMGTMGALAFEPAEHDLNTVLSSPQTLLQWAQAAEAQQGMEAERGAASTRTALRQLLLTGGSPQGARPKVLVDYHPAQDAILPMNATEARQGFEPWLVKFPARGEHPEVCALEELYARLARRCGLDMPPTRFFDLGNQGKRRYSAFGVARFDREAGLRVPIHTLSGLLHADYRLPSLDYDTLLRATRRMTGDEREVAQAFARAVFNVALHNRDDHARNFAWRLGRDDHWRLAPAFDLTYSPGPGGQHTMTIAGEGLAPGARHLMQVAASAGLTEKTARQVLESVLQGCHALLAQPGELADDLPIRKTSLRGWMKAVAVDIARLGD
jgi:serine/threonine-protein kinase HipA